MEYIDRENLRQCDCLPKSGRMDQEQTEFVPELLLREFMSTQ